MTTFRTQGPPWYISPSREEMTEMAGKTELRAFSPSLVEDLANIAAGGEVCPPSTYAAEVRQMVEARVGEEVEQIALPQPGPRPGGPPRPGYPLPGSRPSPQRPGSLPQRSPDQEREVLEKKVASAMRYHQAVCDFLQTVDLSKFPGSPLEQAMSLLKLLANQQGGQPGAGDGALPIFSNQSPEKTAEKLNDLMDEVESLTSEELDMLDPEGKNHQAEDSEESPEGDGQRSGHQGLNKLKVAEDLLADGERKRIILEVSRTLDQLTKLKVRRQVKPQPDPWGDETRQRPMKSLDELSRIPKSAWALRQQNPTYFWYRAATRQLSVRERVTRTEKKQAIFILIDGSGSMRGSKHHKATGVVMNRLKAVVDGDAEVWVSVFDTKLSAVHHAGTPEEAKTLMKEFMKGNFTGGGTDIAAAVKSAHDAIEKMITDGAALYRPQIVVLTDEDTSIARTNQSQIPGTVVHGFAIERKNKSLVEFARSTGGVGVEDF